MNKFVRISILGISAALSTTGCSKSVYYNGHSSSTGSSNSGSSANATATATATVTVGPDGGVDANGDPIVCDPLSGDPGTSQLQPWNGIQGKLSYIPNETPSDPNAPKDLASFFSKSTSVNATIYMTEFNTPTTYFTNGFKYRDASGNASSIKNSNGNVLVEYFGIHFDTNIRLAPWERPGLKQFALLSDDGAILQIDQGQGLQQFLSGDGSHPSTFSCASSAVWIGHGMELPIHIDYYQGPKYHIALMLLWRNVPDEFGNGDKSSPIQDPAFLTNETQCNQVGNEHFFYANTDGTSVPQAAFNQIIQDGWEVVPGTDFILPGSNPVNPCTQQKVQGQFRARHL